MKKTTFNKPLIVIVTLLAILTGARLYLNYQSANEAMPENPLKSDIKVMLYSKTGCSYCTKAKELLKNKGIAYEEVELTNNKDLIIKLVNQTGQNTVPYVFVNDEFIGGYQDLLMFEKAGNLQ